MLTENVRNVTVRLPEALYMDLKRRVLEEQIETGKPVTVSDVVRRAIGWELKA